jgi:hypothetical protein
MKVERLNRWPDRDQRKELYTHNLAWLLRHLNVDVLQLGSDAICAPLNVVLLWRRAEGYNPAAMPARVARDMCDAALGEDGVNRWIENRFQLVR